jgi:pSer/pThr/pTyr-binding forkhead associated (FHA) protein
MAKLTFVFEDGEEVVVPLEERITIGRDENNDVVVDDQRISPQHAELMQNTDGSVQVFDLESDSGTFVNGARTRSCTLLQGDRLSFGPLTAVLDLEDDTRVPPGPAAHPPATEIPASPAGAASTEAKLAELAASIRAGEGRLSLLRAAERQAEDAHKGWLAAVSQLSEEHTAKTAALDELAAKQLEKENVLKALAEQQQEMTAAVEKLTQEQSEKKAALDQVSGEITAARKQLETLNTDTAGEQARLDNLRRQHSELDSRSEEKQKLADSHQAKAESVARELAQLEDHRTALEARIQELSACEERLAQAETRIRDSEAQHATLTAAIAELTARQQQAADAVRDLEARLPALQEAHRLAIAAADDSARAQKEAAESLLRTQEELSAETQRLEQAEARHITLESQTRDLAETEQRLAQVRADLAATEKRHSDFHAAYAAGEASIAALQATVQKHADQEKAAQERIDALRERERQLRAAVDALAVSEKNASARLEDIRKLTLEEQQQRTADYDKLKVGLVAAKKTLEDLEDRLSLLREWKEANTQRSTRLAGLPKDSPEAKKIWNEIAEEKDALLALLTIPRAQGPRVMHVELARRNAVARLPLKSERCHVGETPVRPKNAIGARDGL